MEKQTNKTARKIHLIFLLAAICLSIYLAVFFFGDKHVNAINDNGYADNEYIADTKESNLFSSTNGEINIQNKGGEIKVDSKFTNSLFSFDIPAGCSVNKGMRYTVEEVNNEDYKNEIIISLPRSIGTLTLRFDPVSSLSLGNVVPITKLDEYYANAERSRFLAIEDYNLGSRNGKLISWIDDTGQKYQENGAFIVMADAPNNLYFSAFVESDKSASISTTHREIFFSPEVQLILSSLSFTF